MPDSAIMYGLTHASTVHTTGIQAWPWQLPLLAVLWEAASHFIYGLVTELTRGPLKNKLEHLEHQKG